MTSTNIEIIQKRDDKILVHIQIQDSESWDKEYSQETQLNIILEDYKNGTGNELTPQILEAFQNRRNGEEIKDQEIKNFVNKYEEGNLVLGDNALKIPEIIAKPFSDPFCIFSFKKKEKILKVLDLGKKDLKGLENYGPYSAYCNGNDFLFISGGEINNKKYVENFWKIDLNTLEIECINMIPKKSHSMVVIPGNYVFIVGGQDKETFYLDIENSNGFFGWKPLNNIRVEPALIVFNNYLYCFDNVNSNHFTNEITFEKTDLNSENHEWELIQAKLPNVKFDQKFFGVVQKDNDIMFLGGNIDIKEEDKNEVNERKNFKYNINENKIEESEIPFIEFNLKEKTFLSYNDKVYYIFPDFNKHHPEVIFYQKIKNKIKLVKYESFNQQEKINDLGHAKINHLYLDQPKLHEPEVIKSKNENNKFDEQENKNKEEIVKPLISEIRMDQKKEGIISIPNSKNLETKNDNNSEENNNNENDNIYNKESNLNQENLYPKSNINEDPQIKIDINIKPEIKENESEDVGIEDLVLLKDKLKYSKIEENKDINKNSELILPEETAVINENGGKEIVDSNIKLPGSNNINTEIINVDPINVNIEQPKKENEFDKKGEEPNYLPKNIEIKIEEKKEEQPLDNALKPSIEIKAKNEGENYIGKGKEGANFIERGIIKGTKKLKANLDQQQIKEPKIKVEGNVNVPNPQLKEGNIEGNIKPPIPKVNIKVDSKDDKKEKGFCISGIIVGTKETNPKILKSNVKKNIPNVNIENENPKLIKNIGINENAPYKIPNPNVIISNNHIPEDLINPKLNSEQMKLDDNYTRAPPCYVNINNKVNYPNFEENKNPPIESVAKKNVELPLGKLDINCNIQENINEDKKELNTKFKSNIPELNMTGTDAKTKTPMKLPESTNENNIPPFDINIQKPNVEVNIKEPENKKISDKNFQLYGIIIGTKDPKYNKKNNMVSENKPELIVKEPKLDFNGNIQKKNNEENKENRKDELNKKEGESKQYFKISGIIPADRQKRQKNKNDEIKLGGNFNINVNLEENKKGSENELKGKKIVLPAVSIKKENFISSKVDEGERLNEINVNTDNLKSANVGINGQKIGERIDN